MGSARSNATPYQWSCGVSSMAAHTTSAARAEASSAGSPRITAPAKTDANTSPVPWEVRERRRLKSYRTEDPSETAVPSSSGSKP